MVGPRKRISFTTVQVKNFRGSSTAREKIAEPPDTVRFGHSSSACYFVIWDNP